MKTRFILAILLCSAVGFVSCNNNDDTPAPIVSPVPAKATVSGNAANECPTTTVVLTAEADSATAYVWYNGDTKIDGVTASTYEVTATGTYSVAGVNTTGEGEKSDAKAVTVSSCEITTLLDLTDTGTDWTTVEFLNVDGDDDGSKWVIYSNAAYSASYNYDNNTALTPENYLFLPPLSIATAGKFTFTVQGGDANYYAERFKVIIGEASALTNIESYKNATVLFPGYTLTNGNPYTETIDIPASYNGKTVLIGIVHFDCTNIAFLKITQLKVEHIN